MGKDLIQIIINLRNISSGIAGAIYHDFRKSVKDLDRQNDENVFQRLRSRYVNGLERQLKEAAKKVVEQKNENKANGQLQHELASRVTF